MKCARRAIVAFGGSSLLVGLIVRCGGSSSSPSELEFFAKSYGGPSTDIARGVALTADGAIAVAGETASFGVGQSAKDAWVLKLNGSGEILWQNAYGGSSNDLIYSLKGTSDGGLVAAGETSSFGAGAADAWVLRLDSNGRAPSRE